MICTKNTRWLLRAATKKGQLRDTQAVFCPASKLLQHTRTSRTSRNPQRASKERASKGIRQNVQP